MIDVEQRPLSSFEEQIVAGLVQRMQRCRYVGDQRLDLLGVGHRLRQYGFAIDCRGTQIASQHEVVVVEILLELLGKTGGIEEVVNA